MLLELIFTVVLQNITDGRTRSPLLGLLSEPKTYRPHIHLYHSIWTADYQNEEVCQAQVEEEQVCRGPHGLGCEDNDQNQHIPDDPDSEDQAAHDITLLLNIKHI